MKRPKTMTGHKKTFSSYNFLPPAAENSMSVIQIFPVICICQAVKVLYFP